MDTGQETTVSIVVLAGAVAAIIVWLMKFYMPALMASGGDAVPSALQVIIMAILCYVLPAWRMGGKPTPPPSGQ